MKQDSLWKLRFAPNIGLNSLDSPLFRHSVGGTDPLEHIAFIRNRGFAGIEDNFLKLRPPAEQTKIGEALARSGLEMGCFVNNPKSWDKPLWSSPRAADQAEARRELEDSIEAAKRTGGRVLTTLTGKDPKLPLALQRANLTENLKRLAPLAEKAGVEIALEACNSWDYPQLLLSDVRDAYAVVKAVDSPAVRLVFDIYHVQAMTGDIINNICACWDMITVIQVADNPGRTEMGTGEINWVAILRMLRDKSYTGLVELEHEVSGDGATGEDAMLERLTSINTAI